MDFLSQVASAYYRKYGKGLENFRFIFPNKRSGSFFISKLQSVISKDTAILAPRYGTFEDFVEEIVYERPKENDLNCLLILYNSYCRVMKEQERTAKSFEEFWPWGEVALQDFMEIDKNLAKADSVFKNITDLNELSTDYLEDDQREALEQYFGVSIPKSKIESFWKIVNDSSHGGDEENVRVKFSRLWSLLHDLYHDFRKTMRKLDLTYSGGVYREAYDRLMESGLPIEAERFVFVGFDMLSRGELEIMSYMKELDKADFIWDFGGPAKVTSNPELRFMKKNIELFPQPEWVHIDSKSTWPNVEIFAAPSNVVQAKIVGRQLDEIRRKKEVKSKDILNARIGVVVPDESLLLPLLYSLPEQLSVNLSIGYPLKDTGTMAVVQSIRRLQSRKSKEEGEWAFFHEDVKGLLSQPMISMMVGAQTVSEILGYIRSKRKYRMRESEFSDHPFVNLLFKGHESKAPAQEYGDYIREILSQITLSLNEKREKVSDQLEINHINTYLDALTILEDALEAHGIETDFQTMAIFADKLISGSRVTFEGERTRGVQMLGVLEARNLNFDYLIMPSMTENVFPRKFSKRTFIPDALRGEYGLPRMKVYESVYTYYFYRLLTSAKEAAFIYDSRAGGLNSGDISRYLLQLKNLYADKRNDGKGVRINSYDYSFDVFVREEDEIIVNKKGVEQKLLSMTEEGGITLSASDFLKYIECPIKFYYTKLQNIADDSAPLEYIDYTTQGTIIHEVMELLYVGEGGNRNKLLQTPVLVTSKDIGSLLADDSKIKYLIHRAINKYYLHSKDLNARLTGDAALTAEGMLQVIKTFLRHDMQYGEIQILGCEVDNIRIPDPKNPERKIKVPLRWEVPGNDGVKINMKYSIDRIDRIMVNGKPVIRIIDYKTGSAHSEAESIDEVFESNFTGKDIAQIMIYASILRQLTQNSIPYSDMTGAVYSVGNITEAKKTEYLSVKSVAKKGSLLTLDEISEDFFSAFTEKVTEILDPSIPFEAPKGARCDTCNFRRLCNR